MSLEGYECDGQMTIFDMEQPENCHGCKYKVWLNKDGKRVRSCDRYDGCKFVPNLFTIDFQSFAKKYCKHQGAYLSFGEEGKSYPACSYKNEQDAKCWDDWQKCNEQNCPFFNFGGEL